MSSLQRVSRGLLDTSVIIDFERIDRSLLPRELAMSSLSLAELSAGPHAADDEIERARRQDRLQRTEASISSMPFDERAARAYGVVFAAVVASGRKPRGARAVDLLIAATARSLNVPLYTRNPENFKGLEDVVAVVAV